jgi:7-cyano-7-deazaguanine synthase in queuosine biosynthesis
MEKKDIEKKQIVCTWSGGIDSTALIANLLNNGYEVFAYRLKIYQDKFEKRELNAIEKLLPIFKKLGKIHFKILDGSFLWNFSPDKIEIPRRNKLIIDNMVETICKPNKIYNLGLGEYIGADTWVVKDHVSGADADARSLTAYIYNEYGLAIRLFTLADFGESRFKDDRIRLGTNIIKEDMFLTTNCLNNNLKHCGNCYKCIERHVGFLNILGNDKTKYLNNPEQNEKYNKYKEQMK